MKKDAVFCFVIFQRYSNYYKFGDVTGGCNVESSQNYRISLERMGYRQLKLGTNIVTYQRHKMVHNVILTWQQS